MSQHGNSRRSAADDRRSTALVAEDGRRHVLAEITVIGRRPDCDIQLDGARVSRRHAEIRLIGETLLLVDLASTNGTSVNEGRITSTRLADGDVIAIGAHRLVVEHLL